MESELYVKQAFHSKKFYNPNVSPFLRKASARQQRPLTATISPKADGLFSFPFTTSMTADHALRAFSAEMNECLKLGSGGGGANVRVWVTATSKKEDKLLFRGRLRSELLNSNVIG